MFLRVSWVSTYDRVNWESVRDVIIFEDLCEKLRFGGEGLMFRKLE